jgi:virulence factor Mce-like protein
MAIRQETSRSQYARRGVVLAAVMALIIAMSFVHMKGFFSRSPVVHAQVTNAGAALIPGADVKMRGVIIGKVRDIKPDPDGGARISLRVPKDKLKRVPSNVEARILPATVFGTTFVDLTVPGTQSTTALKSGAVIPADMSAKTLELQVALDDIDRLIDALGPGELATALQAAAQAIDGRGEQIGEMIEMADKYMTRLNPRMPAVRNAVKKLADNLELVEEVAPDYLDATDDSLVAARMIAEEKASITNLIHGSSAMFKDANVLLKREKSDLIGFVNNSAILMRALYDSRYGIGEAIDTHLFLQKSLGSAMRGSVIHMDNYMELTGHDPAYYTNADCPRWGKAVGNNCGAARASASAMMAGGGQ